MNFHEPTEEDERDAAEYFAYLESLKTPEQHDEYARHYMAELELARHYAEKLSGVSKSASSERSDNVYIYTTNMDKQKQDPKPAKLDFGYAVTINPDPYVYMNKRQYKNYTHEQQINMLRRIENAFIKMHPKCKRKALYFEVCPRAKQIHYHALYDMDDTMALKMKDYIGSRVTRINGPSWRGFDFEPCYDEPGWINYIKKSQ